MIRTSITPQQTDVHLTVPPHYVGKRLEVPLYAVEEVTEEPVAPALTMAQFWGLLSNETAHLQRSEENRAEWDQPSC